MKWRQTLKRGRVSLQWRNKGDTVLLLDVFHTRACDPVTDLSSLLLSLWGKKHTWKLQVSLDQSCKSLTFTVLFPHGHRRRTAPSSLLEEQIHYHLFPSTVLNLSATCTDFCKASLFFRFIPIKWLFNREFVSASLLLPFYLFHLTHLADGD